MASGVGLLLAGLLLQADLDRAVAQARFVGTNSCVHCHRDGHKFPTHAVAGKEYSIWVNRDRHSCAYNTLFKDQSVLIAKKMKLKTPPHKNDLCLNCHSTNVPAEFQAPISSHAAADGVGCESCHGGAENWLVPHKLPEWQFWSPSQKESLGFVNTDDVVARTETCVACHVGGEGREVNHDLIAAGHPRLLFEMSAYQAKMPRHWSRAKELEQNSSMAEARLWLAGQFVSATSTLQQIERRAADDHAPWPEFAEYDCSACHHDLARQRWKENAKTFGDGLGNPDWGTWHFALVETLAEDLPIDGPENIGDAINRLRKEMQLALPDRKKVADISAALKIHLEQIATNLPSDEWNENKALEISRRLFQLDQDKSVYRWDGLTQRYLAAVALRQSLMDSRWLAGQYADLDFLDSKNRLLSIRDRLKYIENHDGPASLDANDKEVILQNFSAIFDP